MNAFRLAIVALLAALALETGGADAMVSVLRALMGREEQTQRTEQALECAAQ